MISGIAYNNLIRLRVFEIFGCSELYSLPFRVSIFVYIDARWCSVRTRTDNLIKI